ncbi:hypothetical protein N878_24110 [Pseudomonas sp. EGD-AK9]|jgi:type IV secretory pathway TrbL component|uniref:hypothetical protein n=1 Tax=Pseudomonas sp. EGD-AK9 TaxID=1386078 RepID=UPI0003974632|nr:hypothetical protein [Pseudomonas sp. EGD-AK9]ERI51022.1 hypothetical protein N878_24110 [Pseudomonas sp. EGD-AK9]
MEISANAFNSGLSGIQAGQRRVEQAASEIASNAVSQPPQGSQTPPQNQVNSAPQAAEQTRPDLAQSLVALRVGENEVRASARVVETADEVLGTLIDTRA